MDYLNQQLMTEMTRDELARLEEIKKAWQAYYGNHKKPLRQKPGKPDDNIIVNYARLVVDVGTSFLFGQPGKKGEALTFAVDVDDESLTEEERYLAAVWAENRKLTTLHKLGINGAVTGHAFIKVVDQPGLPRLVVLDPSTVLAEWDPDDVDKVVRWTVRYVAHDPASKRPIERRQIMEPDDLGLNWIIIDEERRAGERLWRTIDEQVWPRPWAPIHHCQNLPDPNVFWGISDLTPDVIDLNDSTNFVLSNINRILRYHAHPKTWGKGFSADQLQVDADGTLILNNPDATLQNLEMLNDLSSSIEFFNRIRQALREITHVPEVALGGMEDASRVSSLALRVMYSPLLMHTGKKQATYGDMLTQLNMHLLELGGYDPAPVANRWPYVLPIDPYQETQTALMQKDLGASKKTLLARLGFDPILEAEQSAEEMLNMGDALLGAFERGELGDG
jgi:hypothetical protein